MDAIQESTGLEDGGGGRGGQDPGLEGDRGVARHERLHTADFDHPLHEAMEARAFWRNTVLSDPDAGFCIIGARARFVSVNEGAALILLGRAAGSFYGLSFFDIFPVDLAAERTAYYHHVLRTERALLVNSVWRGIRCRERWELLPGDARLAGQVLWQVRRSPIPWAGRFELGCDVLSATRNDWGPLAPLDERERSALALIAGGHTNSQIGTRLKITGREALGLKQSIRKKLRVRTTAQLTRIAMMAGLVAPE
jgi:DNA-binding CsgD family transcriptional regulator